MWYFTRGRGKEEESVWVVRHISLQPRCHPFFFILFTSHCTSSFKKTGEKKKKKPCVHWHLKSIFFVCRANYRMRVCFFLFFFSYLSVLIVVCFYTACIVTLPCCTKRRACIAGSSQPKRYTLELDLFPYISYSPRDDENKKRRRRRRRIKK